LQASKQIDAKWITANNIDNNRPNQWMILRKDWYLKEKPKMAITQIAADSKYWLWINGQLAVFEGSLKRGPNPNDSYYDELDLAPFLNKGNNQIALLVWYFGKEGFSHKNSGKAGLIFKCTTGKDQLVSDHTWMAQHYRAYQSCGDPKPNYRLPESNLRFDSRLEISDWHTNTPSSDKGYASAIECGEWGNAPWNNLIKRPIPFWKDYGIVTIKKPHNP
jgi:Alpha-L-rhamnosidase N-terminal domain.